MQERRQFPRIEKETIVFYDILAEEDVILDEGMGKTIDLSARGLHLALPRMAGPGDRLKLTVNLDESMLNLFATVIWSRLDGDLCMVGLTIDHFPAEYQEALEHLFGA